MFQRFTDAAKDLVVAAQGRRRAMGDHKVTTEHLLLALVADTGPAGEALRKAGFEPDQVTRRAIDSNSTTAGVVTSEDDDRLLRQLGIDVDAVRRSVDEALGPGALDRVRAGRATGKEPARSDPVRDTGRHGGFDPASKRVLELSLREALRIKTRHIGPEHIGLGILREEQSTACQLMVDDGLDLAALRSSWEEIALQGSRRFRRSLRN